MQWDLPNILEPLNDEARTRSWGSQDPGVHSPPRQKEGAVGVASQELSAAGEVLH